jgi:hypothetical protein
VTAADLERPADPRSRSGHAAQQPVPRSLLVVAAVALVAGVAMLFVGATRTGVTTDEPYHVQRFENYLHSGWYIVDFQSYDGQPGPGVTDQYVYGPATMWLLHGWNRVLGIDGAGEVATTATAYAARHVGVALIGLLGIAAVSALARIVLRSWGWGLVGAAMLASTPMWLGHSMFNVKDPAVGTGYTLATLGLVIIGREHRGGGWIRVAGPVALGAGTWLALGTRPGMWAGVAAGVVALVVLTALRRRGPGERWGWWRLVELCAALIAAALLLWWVYPEVFGHPLTMLTRSSQSSASFLGIESSRLFVPVRVLFLMPALILALEAVGVVVALRRLVSTRMRADADLTALALVGVQLVALPTVTLIHPSGLYSDLRQLLFGAPAAAFFATFGLACILRRASSELDRRVLPMATLAGSLAIALPMVDQATLFPYNYGYYNVLTDVARAGAVAPLDYYKASMRELAPELPEGEWVVCNPLLLQGNVASHVARLDGAVDCATSMTSPLSQRLPGRAAVEPDPDAPFLAVTTGGIVPANCERVDEVSKRHGPRRVELSTLSRCRLEAGVLSTTAVTDTALRVPYLFSGWYTSSRMDGAESVLVFTPASGLDRDHLSLRLVFDADATLDVEVAGRPVASRRDANTITVPLPPTVVEGASAEHPVTVAISVPGGARSDLTLTSIGLIRS